MGNVLLPTSNQMFSYDADGNMTSDSLWNYAWDAENRLTSMTNVSGLAMSAQKTLAFAYDYLGRRIQKTVATNAAGTWITNAVGIFIYDRWNLIAESDAINNLPTRCYQWGLDSSGFSFAAGGVGGLLVLNIVTNGVFLPSYDGNGDVMLLASANNGVSMSQYEYAPFGEVLRRVGPNAMLNPFRFSAKYQDSENDLFYYGNRYYNASIGKWLSRDALDENYGDNLYRFVANDPLDKIDVLGWWTCGVCGNNVTKNIKRTLFDVEQKFWRASWWTRVSSCNSLVDLLWYHSAANSWDIEPLARMGFEYPDPDCSGSVTFKDQCVYAGSANYALYGKACKLCHEFAELDEEAKANLHSDFTLESATEHVYRWKWHYGDLNSERTWEAIAFVKYGYGRGFSAAGIHCTPNPVPFQQGVLKWHWKPLQYGNW